jgi:hypothetical protein
MNNNNFHNSVYGSAFGANSQVHNHYGEQEFIEITIEDLESRFKETIEIPPDPFRKFNRILLEHRLLVLGGSLDVDKYELALQLALTLVHNQMLTPNSQISQLTVKLWNRKSRQQFIDINTALENTKSPTIFVLKDVEPKNVASINWPQICQTAKPRNHYVLVTTDISFSRWKLSSESRSFFPELKIEEIYTEEILVKELNEQLNKHDFREEFLKHLRVDRQKSIESIAQQLKTTNNISRFVQLFRKEIEKFRDEHMLFVEGKKETEPEPIKIQELIEIAKNDEQFIRKLYYEILNPREQLLALGLSFFNGCFEDQLFAALERVVQEVWQKRDPALQAIDYCDLDKLENEYFQLAQNDLYESVHGDFKFVQTEAYKIDIRSIKILSQDNRKMLLKVAWETHRRQIVTALDVLVKLVEESVQENYYDQGKWELYGNSTRSEQLRCAVGETLSDIGLVSTSAFSSVEGCLLRLAMNEDWQVRNVVTSAISGWYNRDNQKDPRLLFRILQTFYDITMEKERQSKKDENNYTGITKEINVKNNQNWYIQKNNKPPDKKGVIAAWIKSIIFEFFNMAKESEETEEKEYYIKSEKFEHQDYIGATVAVVVGDAIWNYDDGNGRLLEEFYKWLQELSESRLRLVHLFFGYHTLFYAVPIHFKELRIREMLKTITQRHRDLLFKELPFSLNYAIARSLAHAYAWVENRNEVQTMLDQWYNEVKKRPSLIDRTKISEADALLKTVVLTYGLIQYDEEPGRLTPETAFERLSAIIKKEDHPIVREAVVFAICNQTRRYFKKVASHLQDLVANLSRSEGDKIVQTLTEIYLEERASLNNGDGEIKVNGRYYQIWTNLEQRPRTPIEKAMDDWAKAEQKPVAQEIAIQSLVAFVKALEEQVYIQ